MAAPVRPPNVPQDGLELASGRSLMPDAILSADALRDLQPVNDAPDDKPTDALGLCLSGGGFRAMLFHLGAIWRLNERAFQAAR